MEFITGSFLFLWGIVSSLFPFVILLSLLIFIHEWGHFIVARLCGVRVEVFSLGFGKKLLKKKWGDTTYCLSLIPLGGYVKMFGDQYGKEVPEKDKDVAFLNKKLWQRTAVVLAGPLMNFVLAVFILAGLAMYGNKRMHPVVGEVAPSSLAEQVGFKAGDHIISVNDQAIKSLEEFNKIVFDNSEQLLNIKMKGVGDLDKTITVQPIKQEVGNRMGLLEKGGVIEGLSYMVPMAVVGVSDSSSLAGKAGLRTFDQILSVDNITVNSWDDLSSVLLEKFTASKKYWNLQVKSKKQKTVKEIHIQKPKNLTSELISLGLHMPDLFISDLKKNSPADQAGLKRGDLIAAINGEAIADWNLLMETTGGFTQEKQSLSLSIKRDGEIKDVSITPEKHIRIVDGKEDVRYMLGVVSGHHHGPAGGTYVHKESVFTAGWVGLKQSLEWCAMTGLYIKKLLTGQMSRRTLGGAIAIGRVAYDTYSYGLIYFFNIMAILSIQLFLINLLPVPVLDGGHLLFYICELFNGGPLSLKKIMVAQQIGLVMILFLVIFTTFNDLDNWFNLW